MSARRRGFTLIELIAALVVIAVLAAMMVPFLGVSVTKAGQALLWLDSPMQLNAVMANITADYRQNFTGDLLSLQLKISVPATSGYGELQIAPNGNRFVKFVGGVVADINGDPADPEYGKYLEVTIQPTLPDRASETLTHLFTKQTE
jgi:prepilin-type N-terminal cleavage/methylation domain-containing protein